MLNLSTILLRLCHYSDILEEVTIVKELDCWRPGVRLQWLAGYPQSTSFVICYPTMMMALQTCGQEDMIGYLILCPIVRCLS